MKINQCDISFRYVRIGYGVDTLSAWHKDFVGPIGTVWFVHVGKACIEILDSYVTVLCRRKGVRTWLHRQMLEGYPDTKRIITCRAANKASASWMKKMGYKSSAKWGWMLKVDK